MITSNYVKELITLHLNTLNSCLKCQENCPTAELEKIRSESGCCPDVDSEAFAKYMDIADPLKEFRAKFQYPKKRELPIGEAVVNRIPYFPSRIIAKRLLLGFVNL